MPKLRCDYCGETGPLEYKYESWPVTVHNGGGPGAYQEWHELEGWFCKGVLPEGEDELDPACYESCWDKYTKEER